MDLKKVCRTCLSSDVVMFPLFDANVKLVDEKFRSAVEMLETFTSVPINNKDYLPDHICGTCLNEIHRAYSFKRKCEKSEMLLNQLKKVDITFEKLIDLSNRIGIDSELIGTCEIQSIVKEELEETQFAEVECVPDVQMNFKIEPKLEIKDSDCDDNEYKTEEQLKCSACENQFESLDLFSRHILTDHIEENLCKLCNEEIYGSLFDHSVKHLSTSNLAEIKAEYCQHCFKLFADMKMLKLHVCPSNASNRSYTNNEMKQNTHQSNVNIKETGDLIDITLEKRIDLFNRNGIDSEFIGTCKIQSSVNAELQKTKFAEVECVPDVQMNFKTEPELEIEDFDCDDYEFKTEEQLKCSACENQFESRDLFCRHIITDHIEGNLCKLCNEVIDDSLFDHSVKHLPASDLDRLRTEYCQHCFKPFADLKLLRQHACPSNAPNRSDYNNEMEQNNYQSNVDIKETEDLIDSNMKHQCSVCSKIYGRKNSLTIHMRIHTGETPFQCEFCSEKFRLRHSLRVHMEIKHINELPDGKPKFQCTVCLKIFACKNHLVGHMLTHTGEKPLQCKFCSDKFRHKPSLVTHMKTLHPKEFETDKSEYQCSICSQGFSYNNDLVTHMRIHSDEKPFPCEFCSKKFRFRHMVRVHMEKKHTNELPDGKPTYQCNVCSKVFGYNSDLIRHMRSHTDEKPFQCKLCLNNFRYRHLLRVHMEKKHIDELPIDKPKFQCNICSKIFGYNNSLIRHMRMHTGEKPFQCKLCPEKFQHKHVMRVHMETKHINELPDCKPKNQCTFCFKIFDYGRSLRTHLETKHSNELPADKPPKFQCHLCSKAFAGNNHLLRHILVHTGEKPFKCQICTNAYRSNKELNRHLRMKHTTDNMIGKDSQSLADTQQLF